jgi:hypothetical protein
MGPDTTAVPAADQQQPQAATGAPQQPQSNQPTQTATAQQPQTERDTSLDNTQIPKQEMQQGPVVLHEAPKTGFRGMLDRVLDAVAGTQGTKTYVDDQGNHYVGHPDLTGKQKFARVLQLGLTGAAAAMANSKGAGNQGKGFAAAVQNGMNTKQAWNSQANEADESAAKANKQNLVDQANLTLLQQKVAANQFSMTRQELAANREDMNYYDGLKKSLPEGSTMLGRYTFDDLHNIKEKDPDFWKHHYANQTVPIPYYDPESGKAAGVEVYLMPPNTGSQLMPKGTKLHVYAPPTEEGGEPTFKEVKPSDPMTLSQYIASESSQYAKKQQWQLQQADLEAKQNLAGQRQGKQEEEEARTQNLRNGGTGSVNGNGGKGAGTGAGAGTATAATDNELLRQIGTGQIAIDRWDYILSRMKDPNFAKTIAEQYPDLDTSKIKSYVKTYQDFTSGHTARQLNSGNTAIGHMADLYNLSTGASAIPLTEAKAKYKELSATVIGELGQFYGESTIPGQVRFEKGLDATLPYYRKAAIREQIHAMGVKMNSFMQQWENSAPSDQYHTPMPGISAKALQAWKAVDPQEAGEFEQHQKELQAKRQQATQPHQQQNQPAATVRMKAPNGEIATIPADQVAHYKTLGAVEVK